MGPAVPGPARLVADQADVRLVHQGGRLKSLPRRLPGQALRRKPAQLGVDQRQQFLGRSCVSPADGIENAADLFSVGFDGRPPFRYPSTGAPPQARITSDGELTRRQAARLTGFPLQHRREAARGPEARGSCFARGSNSATRRAG